MFNTINSGLIREEKDRASRLGKIKKGLDWGGGGDKLQQSAESEGKGQAVCRTAGRTVNSCQVIQTRGDSCDYKDLHIKSQANLASAKGTSPRDKGTGKPDEVSNFTGEEIIRDQEYLGKGEW